MCLQEGRRPNRSVPTSPSHTVLPSLSQLSPDCVAGAERCLELFVIDKVKPKDPWCVQSGNLTASVRSNKVHGSNLI